MVNRDFKWDGGKVVLLKALQLSNPKDAGQQEAVFGADRSHKDRTLHF